MDESRGSRWEPAQDAAAQATVRAARARFARLQEPSGRWTVFCDVGASSTAHAVIALHFVGELSVADARAAARGLRRQWLGPGRGFAAYPGAGEGDLSTTAL